MDLANLQIIFSPTFTIFQFVFIVALTGSRSQFANYEQDFHPINMKLSDDSCYFPSRWIGEWFESGVGQTITINHTRINSKGRCVEADGDKFILYSQSDECYRCVVFHEKHLNVLQYKETFCYPADPSGLSLRSLCRRIAGDAPLYSMFRLNAVPIHCPFLGSFTFAYSRGQGVCQSPVSTIDTCISNSKLVLNYQACYDVPGTESKVEELECLALWREGSTRYMVALLKYHHPSSYEERFRCFAYEKGNKFSSASGTSRLLLANEQDADKVIFRVAQSGDATCLGLTPVEGSKTFTLRRREVPVQTTCQFPTWLQVHTQWLNLDGNTSYAFDNSTLQITNITETSDTDTDDDDILLMSARCIKEHGQDLNENRRTFILRSTTGCQIGYTCLRVNKRDSHIVELQLGKRGRDLESACHSFNFNEDLIPFVTLTSSTPEIRECPYTGQFDITEMSMVTARRCRQEFKGSVLIGCTGLDSIHMNMYCPNTQKVHEEYTCNGWWEDGGDTFLIVSSSPAGEEIERFCFRIEERVLELSPQELKRREMKVIDYDSSRSGENEISGRGSQKMFNFIKYTSNCHRRWPGGLESSSQLSIAFNTTNLGICSNENKGHRFQIPTNAYRLILIFTFSAGFFLL